MTSFTRAAWVLSAMALGPMAAFAAEPAAPSAAVTAAQARLDEAAAALADALRKEGGAHAPAPQVRVEVSGGNQKRVVVLADGPGSGPVRAEPKAPMMLPVPSHGHPLFPPEGPGGGGHESGLVTMSPTLSAYFEVPAGVLVVHSSNWPGLEDGDVLVRVDGRTVTDGERARRILGTYAPGEMAVLTVRRHRETIEVNFAPVRGVMESTQP